MHDPCSSISRQEPLQLAYQTLKSHDSIGASHSIYIKPPIHKATTYCIVFTWYLIAVVRVWQPIYVQESSQVIWASVTKIHNLLPLDGPQPEGQLILSRKRFKHALVELALKCNCGSNVHSWKRTRDPSEAATSWRGRISSNRFFRNILDNFPVVLSPITINFQ